MSMRTDISEVLKKPNLDKKTAQKLKLALEAKQFAEKELHLSHTDNYNSYVQLDRPYVTYIVRVALANKLEPKDFWFPIVGSVPYKGYFSKISAEEEAQNYNPQIYDTYVRGASAYSTLGWFDDPILSSMIRYSDAQLVNLIIHETVHATIFIKGHVDFNERLATFIGNLGVRRFYLAKEGSNSSTVQMMDSSLKDEKIFSNFISKEIELLKKWYDENPNHTLVEKKNRLKEIQTNFKKNVLGQLKVYQYKSFINEPLNNAKILSLATYVQDLSDFQVVFDSFDQDLDQFLKYCHQLEESDDPVLELKNKVKSLSGSSSKN